MNPTTQDFQPDLRSPSSPRQSSFLFPYLKQLVADLTRARWALLIFLVVLVTQYVLDHYNLRSYMFKIAIIRELAAVSFAALVFSNPILSSQTNKTLLFVGRALFCILVMLVPYCLVYLYMFSYTAIYNSSSGPSYMLNLISPTARFLCLTVAVGAVIGTSFRNKWMFWATVVVAPKIVEYITKFCDWAIPSDDRDFEGVRYLFPAEYLSLGISTVLFLVAFRLWHPEGSGTTGTSGSNHSQSPPEPQPGSEPTMSLYDIFRNDLRRALWPFFILCLVQGLSLAVSATPFRTLLGQISLLAQYASAVALAVIIFSGPLDKQSRRYSRRIFSMRAGMSILLCCLPPVVFMSLSAVMQAVSLNSTEVYFIVALQLVGWVSAYCMTAGAGAIIASLAHRNIWQYWFFVFTFSILVYAARWLIADLLPRNIYGRASEVYWTVFLSPFQVTTFAIAIAALVYGYKRLNRQSSRIALIANELQDLSLRHELFRKELHLQRTNLMFTLAATLLGFIGITMAHGAGQEIMGFSTADIRVGIFSVMLAPVLTIILPIMIGSTAAASERAMGVWLWQEALPVSWRRVIWTKVLVVSGLCLVVAGVLPYLLQLTMLDEMPVRMIYRETWPLWVALLCAAIGFCCGSIARDDYQGLLMSIVPLSLIIGVMYVADPNGLVFPFMFGFDEPFIREWWLAIRMLLIAAMFVLIGAILLKQSGQPWWRRAAAHGAAICAATFALTLWNVVTERSLLGSIPRSQPPEVMLTDKPTTAEKPKFKLLASLTDSHVMNNSFGILDQEQVTNNRHLAGSVVRQNTGRSLWTGDKSTNPFVISASGDVREFPQSVSRSIQSMSPDGRWILAGREGHVSPLMSLESPLNNESALVAGPMGLAVPLRWLPETWQENVLNWESIAYPEENQITAYRSGGKTDLELSIGNFMLVWENGKQQLPEKLWKSSYVFKGGPNSAYIFQWPPFDSNSTTVSAILKPVSGVNHGVLVGWSRGEAEGVTDDFRWAYSHFTNNDLKDNSVSLSELKPGSRYEDYCCMGDWMNPAISAGESNVKGTSTALLLEPKAALPVFSTGQTRVIVTPYYSYDREKTIPYYTYDSMNGARQSWPTFPLVELGVVLSDAGDPTRSVKIVIDNLGRPGQEKLSSPFTRPGTVIRDVQNNNLKWEMKPMAANGKALALAIKDHAAVIYNPGNDWFKDGSWKVLHVTAKEHITTSLFTGEDKYILGTTSDLWMLDLAEISNSGTINALP